MTDEHVINTMMIEEMRIEIKQTGGQAKVQWIYDYVLDTKIREQMRNEVEKQ